VQLKTYLQNLSSRERTIALIGLVIGISATWLLIAPPQWTGFSGRTLWDWLDLGAIPAVLILAAFIIRRQVVHSTGEVATQNGQNYYAPVAYSGAGEAILQAYFDQMTELLLDRELQYTNEEATRQLARFRTLSVLRGLDGSRKGLVVKFLHETRLIHAKDGKTPIIDLRDADLRGADLRDLELQFISLKRAYLQGANLSRTNLSMAKMNGARLMGADLSDACLNKAEMIRSNLTNADLSGAELHSTNLVWTDFNGANLRGADMQWAVLLWANFSDTQFDHKTILPDHSNWISTVDFGRYTDNKHPEFWSSETDKPLQRDIATKDISSIINDSIQ
jgi:uncharacterized protein YjbI with pentapeptide repeats